MSKIATSDFLPDLENCRCAINRWQGLEAQRLKRGKNIAKKIHPRFVRWREGPY
jgi:hypothetical protein